LAFVWSLPVAQERGGNADVSSVGAAQPSRGAGTEVLSPRLRGSQTLWRFFDLTGRCRRIRILFGRRLPQGERMPKTAGLTEWAIRGPAARPSRAVIASCVTSAKPRRLACWRQAVNPSGRIRAA